MKKNAAAGIALAWILFGAACASRPPEENLAYGQRRFEEQMKRYPDRDSRAQEKARDAEAAKDSMVSGRVK